jgi:hypothetical protein
MDATASAGGIPPLWIGKPFTIKGQNATPSNIDEINVSNLISNYSDAEIQVN